MLYTINNHVFSGHRASTGKSDKIGEASENQFTGPQIHFSVAACSSEYIKIEPFRHRATKTLSPLTVVLTNQPKIVPSHVGRPKRKKAVKKCFFFLYLSLAHSDLYTVFIDGFSLRCFYVCDPLSK